jgi:hypothetical protein
MACSSFGAADDAAGTAEAGTLDGGMGLTDASTDGRGITDARACDPATCTSFDDGTLPASWTVNGLGSELTLVEGGTTPNGFALDLVFKDSLAFLSVDVAGATKVAVTANVQVVQFGDGEVDLLGIAEAPMTEVSGLYLVHPAAKGASLSVELPKNQGQLPLGAPFTSYTPVKLELDLAGRTFAYTAGTEVLRGVVNTPPSPAQLAVLIGAQYSSGATLPWHVRYDDIDIVVTR